MRKDNTQNYQTPYSKIHHYNDFIDNEEGEKEELSKMKRTYLDNENDTYELPNKFRHKFNKVTRKYDDITEDEVDGRIEQIEDDFPSEKSNKTFKIQKFEAFQSGMIDDRSLPRTNTSLDDNNNDRSFENDDDYCGCGCCGDCSGDMDCVCCEECTCAFE